MSKVSITQDLEPYLDSLRTYLETETETDGTAPGDSKTKSQDIPIQTSQQPNSSKNRNNQTKCDDKASSGVNGDKK